MKLLSELTWEQRPGDRSWPAAAFVWANNYTSIRVYRRGEGGFDICTDAVNWFNLSELAAQCVLIELTHEGNSDAAA
jgi:hypothetical protein